MRGNKNRLDLLPIFQSAIAKLTSTKSAEKIGLCTCSITVLWVLLV